MVISFNGKNLSLAREHLGFDPTITRVNLADGKTPIHYLITMHGRNYQTYDVLFDWKADLVVGRGTRVWKVYPEDNPSQHFALKEVWLEEGQPSEGEIWHNIQASICQVKDGQRDKARQKFERLFLQLQEEYVVPVSSGVCNPSVMEFSRDLDIWKQDRTQQVFRGTIKESTRMSPRGNPYTYQVNLPQRGKPYQKYATRRQYRTLWKDVDHVTVFNDLTNVNQMLVVLRDTIAGKFCL